MSWRLASKASVAFRPACAKSTMSLSWRVMAALVASLRAVTSSPISLTFLPMSAVYFANSSKSALSAFLSIAALLASISWRLTSNASAAAKPTFFKVLISSSRLAIALLKPSLASFCSSNAALLAFTSALMALTTSAVFTNASLLSLTVSVKSPNASSCAATTSFKPNPPKPSASTSACVASRTVLLPSSLVATKLLPAAKPLTACSSSIVFNNRAELSLSKVNFPVSWSNLVFSPKTVWNAIAFCAFSGIEPRSLSAAPAALLTTAAAIAKLNALTLNFFMFFTFLWWV